jgi:hypothetical protein
VFIHCLCFHRYVEHGLAKNELVKVRVCLDCAKKIFYEKLQRLDKQAQQQRQSDRKKKGRKEEEGKDPGVSLPQQMSHDDILRALFDSSTAAECKDDDETDVPDEHPAKRARPTLGTNDDDDDDAESDRLLKTLMP